MGLTWCSRESSLADRVALSENPRHFRRLPVNCPFRAVIPYWSSFSFSAVLTVRFQIDFPALAARLAFLCSSLEATMRFPSLRTISNTNLFSPRFKLFPAHIAIWARSFQD
jgi:hypothetical protein